VCTRRSCALQLICVDVALFVKVLRGHVFWPSVAAVGLFGGSLGCTSRQVGFKVQGLGFGISLEGRRNAFHLRKGLYLACVNCAYLVSFSQSGMCAHGGAVRCKLICMDVALFLKCYGVLFGGRWWLWLDCLKVVRGFA
jgi:hypothetical protein